MSRSEMRRRNILAGRDMNHGIEGERPRREWKLRWNDEDESVTVCSAQSEGHGLIHVVEIRENETVISISELERLRAELSSLKQERDRVASGKLNCADCGSILARW